MTYFFCKLFWLLGSFFSFSGNIWSPQWFPRFCAFTEVERGSSEILCSLLPSSLYSSMLFLLLLHPSVQLMRILFLGQAHAGILRQLKGREGGTCAEATSARKHLELGVSRSESEFMKVALLGGLCSSDPHLLPKHIHDCSIPCSGADWGFGVMPYCIAQVIRIEKKFSG